jgi:hypothetical protein
MTPYKESIFRELEQILAAAEPEQIERLLSDIATGTFSETAQTRAGTNDNHCNVTGINELVDQRRADAAGMRTHGGTVRLKGHGLRDRSEQLSTEARNQRRAGYSS